MLTWRNRTAEAIMLGASLYNRQVQLQQLYIKQKANQLILSGEASAPSNSSDWLSPDFRGEISASINQLGEFAALFGANTGDFAGKIAIEGTMNTRDRKLGGHLALDGASLTLFKTAIDTLSAKLNLKATELEIEQLNLKRKNDSLTAQGKIDMSHEHNYSGAISATVDNLDEYLSIFRGQDETNSKATPANIQITIDSNKWDARGVIDLPNSSLLNFTANFPLRIGTDWNAVLVSPLNVTLDFLKATTKDVDLALQGEVDFQDTNDLGIKRTGATPIFDLTLRPIDCVGKIEIGTVTVTLAPVVAELEFRGRLFQSDWTIGLREQTSTQSFTILNLNGIVREFPLCFSGLSTEEKTLLLGVPARPEARLETVRPKNRTKPQ